MGCASTLCRRRCSSSSSMGQKTDRLLGKMSAGQDEGPAGCVVDGRNPRATTRIDHMSAPLAPPACCSTDLMILPPSVLTFARSRVACWYCLMAVLFTTVPACVSRQHAHTAASSRCQHKPHSGVGACRKPGTCTTVPAGCLSCSCASWRPAASMHAACKPYGLSRLFFLQDSPVPTATWSYLGNTQP